VTTKVDRLESALRNQKVARFEYVDASVSELLDFIISSAMGYYLKGSKPDRYYLEPTQDLPQNPFHVEDNPPRLKTVNNGFIDAGTTSVDLRNVSLYEAMAVVCKSASIGFTIRNERIYFTDLSNGD
jgi:hypothetical protein